MDEIIHVVGKLKGYSDEEINGWNEIDNSSKSSVSLNNYAIDKSILKINKGIKIDDVNKFKIHPILGILLVIIILGFYKKIK